MLESITQPSGFEVESVAPRFALVFTLCCTHFEGDSVKK
jgi:hypothetical protein